MSVPSILALGLLFHLGVAGAVPSVPKPFNFLERSDFVKTDGNKAAQICLIRNHFAAHLDHVVSKIIPRGEAEISDLLRPQFQNGKKFYVAYGINYADLFHYHLRYPNEMNLKNADVLYDPSLYHLQYHSLEHIDLLQLNWLYELRDLKDSQTQNWSNERIVKMTTPPPSFSATDESAVISNQLSEMDETSVLRLAQIWDKALGSGSPGVDLLWLRVRKLNNPYDFRAMSSILKYRSVATHLDRYEVLPSPTIDLPNVWQPVTLFFASLEENVEVAKEIRSYLARTGQKVLANFDGIHQDLLPGNPSARADALATYKKVLNLLRNDPNSQNSIKQVALDLPSFTTALTVSDKYVYAIQYHLNSKKPCLSR